MFFYYKTEIKQTVRESACDILTVWKKAGISTTLKKHVIQKIEQYFIEVQKLKRNKENKAKRLEGIKQKEQKGQHKLEDLFDIVHANALNMIRIEEDRQFLLAQRQKGYPGQISGLDIANAIKEAKKKEKEARLLRLPGKRKY